MKTWQDCARDFRELTKERAWAFALPIAAAITTTKQAGKVSLADFARAAESSDSTVRRYYAAWERAADAGVVPHAADVFPADVDHFQLPTRPFSDFYNTASEGLYPKRVERALELHGTEKIVGTLSEERKADLVTEILKTATPEQLQQVRSSAQDRLDETYARENANAAVAKDRREAAKQAAHSLRFQAVDAHLLMATKRLMDAVHESTGVHFSDEEAALLRLRWADVQRWVTEGTAGTDLDAELKALVEQ